MLATLGSIASQGPLIIKSPDYVSLGDRADFTITITIPGTFTSIPKSFDVMVGGYWNFGNGGTYHTVTFTDISWVLVQYHVAGNGMAAVGFYLNGGTLTMRISSNAYGTSYITQGWYKYTLFF